MPQLVATAGAFSTIAAAVLAVLALGGCASSPKPVIAEPAPRVLEGIEQRARPDGGRTFVACIDCSAPTPKTLRGSEPRATELAATSQPPGPGLHSPAVVDPAAMSASEPDAPSTPLSPPQLSQLPTLTVRAELYFDSGRTQPVAASLHRLSQILPALQRASHIEVIGYTDSRGSAAFNRRLAAGRAGSVAERIVEAIPPELGERLVLSSSPQCCYVAANRTATQRRANRRVEIVMRLPADAQAMTVLHGLAAHLDILKSFPATATTPTPATGSTALRAHATHAR